MPSMKAPFRIPAAKGKKAWPLISVFPGDHREKWAGYGGRPDNFRLMLGDVYYTRPGEQKSFFTAAELGQLLGSWIARAFGVEPGEVSGGTVRVNLYLPQGAKVWYRDGGMLPEPEIVVVPPRLNGDGIWVVTLGYSRKTVPVTTVKPRTQPLAECSIEPEEMEENE